jgi:glycosyltransferase involved in cell wall biosynthesis
VNNTIKVCHLTSVHYYNDTRIYYKECCTLAERGYETYFIVPEAPTQFNSLVHFCSVVTNRQNRLSRMTHTVWSIYSQARRLNADIYHFHDPELMPIGLLLRIQGKKVIYDVHEDVPRDILTKEWIPQYLRRLLSYIIEFLENYAAAQLSAVVTATPHINQRFIKINKHSIDIKNYPIKAELYPDIANTDRDRNAICYIGGINKNRGIFDILEAISQSRVKLLLAGSFDRNEERDKAITLAGWENVRELGYIDRQGVIETLQQSMAGLVVLHPTIAYLNALPIKMFEYMSAGIPVIASNFPLWREIIESERCGICVDPQDRMAIAAAIKWISTHPIEARKMGENGRKAVEKKYNWEEESKALLNLYSELSSGIN